MKTLFIITACFIALDMATGIVKALRKKKFTSSIMREGLFHKCGSILCILFGGLVDYAQKYIDIGVSIPMLSAVCGYIILMEIGSIIENLSMINPQIVPKKLKTYFVKINK